MSTTIKHATGKISKLTMFEQESQKTPYLLYVLFFVFMVITISCKAYYFIDDIWSYQLANNKITHLTMSKGKETCVANVPPTDTTIDSSTFMSIMLAPIQTPENDCMLNYKNIWLNQAQDTHPPLYYTLLHTICLFCPGVFSKCFAAIINIFFAIATLFIIRKLIRMVTDDKFILTAISFVLVFSSTILNATALFRMYIMAMFWVTLQTYIILKYIRKAPDKHFYRNIFYITLFGTLTHYYCPIYFAFSSVVFTVCLLADKRYKDFCKFVLVSLLSLVVAYVIFPAMSQHILSCMHGKIFAASIFITTDFWVRLRYSFGFINSGLFGGTLPLFFIIVAISFIVIGNSNKAAKLITRESLLLIMPSVCFFLLVTKTFPLNYNILSECIRFFIPIFSIALTSVLLLAFTALKQCLNSKNAHYAILILSITVIIGSWLHTDWNDVWLYRSYNKNSIAHIYKDTDCVVIGNIQWPLFYELTSYKSITRYNTVAEAKKSPLYKSLASKDKIVIAIVHKDITAEHCDLIINRLFADNSNISQYTIFRSPYFGESPIERGPGFIYYLQRQKPYTYQQKTL